MEKDRTSNNTHTVVCWDCGCGGGAHSSDQKCRKHSIDATIKKAAPAAPPSSLCARLGPANSCMHANDSLAPVSWSCQPRLPVGDRTTNKPTNRKMHAFLVPMPIPCTALAQSRRWIEEMKKGRKEGINHINIKYRRPKAAGSNRDRRALSEGDVTCKGKGWVNEQGHTRRALSEEDTACEGKEWEGSTNKNGAHPHLNTLPTPNPTPLIYASIFEPNHRRSRSTRSPIPHILSVVVQ